MKKLWLAVLAATLMTGLLAGCEDCEDCDNDNNVVTRACEFGSGSPCNCDLNLTANDEENLCSPSEGEQCLAFYSDPDFDFGICSSGCGKDSEGNPIDYWGPCPDTGFGGLDVCLYQDLSDPPIRYCGILCTEDAECPEDQVCTWNTDGNAYNEFGEQIIISLHKSCKPNPDLV